LEETLHTELIPLPRKIPTPNNVDHNKHCRYHKNFGHNTKECSGLRDKIEELVQARHLKQYVQRSEGGRLNFREGDMERREGKRWERRKEESRGEGRERSREPQRRYFNVERRDRGRSPMPRRGRRPVRPIRGVINTISRGFAKTTS